MRVPSTLETSSGDDYRCSVSAEVWVVQLRTAYPWFDWANGTCSGSRENGLQPDEKSSKVQSYERAI